MSQIILIVPTQSIMKKKLKGYEVSEKHSSTTSEKNSNITAVSIRSGQVLLVSEAATQASGTYKASRSASTITTITVRLRSAFRTAARVLLRQLY
mmetsp:Transcript_6883/g.16725  ORF Transcript_6883/g.16725 Transcript_6883/m.16725 type:complete len:95 (+) Transcript_6883:70-354(+)